MKALTTTIGKVRIGIIDSLGERSDPAAVRELAKLVNDADAATALAVARALGKITGPEAVKALSSVGESAAPTLRAEINDARLACAHALRDSGKNDDAAAIYKALYKPGDMSPASMAAFLGLATTLGEKAAPMIADGLKSDEAEIRRVAAEAARTVNGAAPALAAQLPSLPPSAQALLIPVLAERADASVLPAVTALATSTDASVRVAALTALGAVGNATVVPLLGKEALNADKENAEAARASLATIRGADVNAAIVQTMQTSEPAIAAVLIQALTARNAVDTVPALLTATSASDEGIRVEAFTALATLAKPDQLPALVTSLVKAQGDKTRGEAETTVVNVAQKIRDEKARATATLAALPSAKSDPKVTASLLRVLSRIGDESALGALRDATGDANAETKEAAIRALAGWPTPVVLPELKRIAETGADESQRLIALRGFLRALALPSKRSEEETLGLYETALKLAPSSAEKKTALAGLANVRTERVKEVLKPFLSDPEYKAEAEAALGKVAKATAVASASENNAEAKLALDGKIDTRWSTGVGQKPGQWFQLDLGWERSVSRVVLDAKPSAGDYPRGYEVYVSKNTTDWGAPVAKGQGKDPVTDITFSPKDGRYVRIVQTGTDAGLWWSIHEIKVDSQ